MRHAFILLLICGSARATDYFVATNGDDSADGLTVSSAWATIGRSVNRVAGGDRLLIRGGEYRGRTTVTNNSGSPASRIVVAGYSGEVVRIKGSRVVTGWELFTNAVWKKTGWTNNSQQVFADDVKLQQLGWPSEYLANRACSCADWLYLPFGYSCTSIVNGTINVGQPYTNMPAGSFFYATNSQTLYVRLAGDASPTDKVMEASVDLGVFYDDSAAGSLHLKDMRFEHASTLDVIPGGFPLVILGPNGIMENCLLDRGDANGLAARSNARILSCRISRNGMQGISFGVATNVLISGCTIVSNNESFFNLSDAAGIKIIPSAGATVENCEVAWNKATGIWFDTCHAGHPIVVRNNYVHDNAPRPNLPGDPSSYTTKGIFIEISSNAEVYDNLVVSNSHAGIALSGSESCRVFNNTVSGTHGVSGGHRGLSAITCDNPVPPDFLVRSNQVFNNLLVDNLTDYDVIAVPNNGRSVTANDFDFNAYFRTTGAGTIFPTSQVAFAAAGQGIYNSIGAWRAATGYDTNSLAVNPLIGSNLVLTAGSPCVDSGKIGRKLTLDFTKNPRPVDGNGDGRAGLDIGAYEFMTTNDLVHYVDAAATNSIPPFTSWATASTNISDAIAAAADGHMVLVGDGSYPLASEIFVDKGISLRSLNGPSASSIDGSNAARCMNVTHSNAVIDGFTIYGSTDAGAYGVRVDRARIQNSIFHSHAGRGVRLENHAVLADSTVVSNSGGGVLAHASSLVERCTIAGNEGGGNGSGIYVSGVSTIDSCVVRDNESLGWGGGIYLDPGGKIRNCVINDNRADYGGGVYAQVASVISDTLLTSNRAVNEGGGMMLLFGARAERCDVENNRAGGSGGGLFVSGGTNETRNCVIARNTAGDTGGGLCVTGGAQFVNCTIVDNVASNRGGGFASLSGGALRNSILFTNRAPVDTNVAALGAPPILEVNLTTDPMFVNLAGADYRLRYGSPALDASGPGQPADDLTGGVRPIDGDADGTPKADMGAFESRALHYVKASGSTPLAPYLSWSNAATDLQSAILESQNGDIVLVEDGTYPGGINVYRSVTIRSLRGPAAAILDGNNSTRVLLFTHAGGVLEGFTLRRGRADAGAGVYFHGGGTLRRSVLKDNNSIGDFGGQFAHITSAPRYYCQLNYDLFVHEGGGAALMRGGGVLENCVVISNRAVYGGGVTLINGGLIQNCTIAVNAATNAGGFYAKNGGTLRNAIAFGNLSPNGSNYIIETTASVSFTDSAPLPAGGSNFSDDALFAPGFKLAPGSPCVDAGGAAGAPAADFDGLPRPLDGNASATAEFDVGAFEYAATNVDSDADGLSDAAEAAGGTQVLVADTDGDQMRDGDEIIAGTNPTNSASYFSVAGPSPDEIFVVRWGSATGRTYFVQRTTNMLDAFQPWASNIPAAPPVNAWTDAAPDDVRRFYRVGVQP